VLHALLFQGLIHNFCHSLNQQNFNIPHQPISKKYYDKETSYQYMSEVIYPNWPAPQHIRAFTTIRTGGLSAAPFNSLNLGDHVGDAPLIVEQNREILLNSAKLPEPPRWLSQQHGCRVIESLHWSAGECADGIVTNTLNHVCPVLTADCLPILLCNQQGDRIAAIHAGWRGLANGVVENAIASFGLNKQHIMAWLGPAIGPENFEVGEDVVNNFVQHDVIAKQAFKQTDDTHYNADIYLLARQRLRALGVTDIYGGQFCTVNDPTRFFSYRRDNVTGRMASVIWIQPH
jgi:YfiH family protein